MIFCCRAALIRECLSTRAVEKKMLRDLDSGAAVGEELAENSHGVLV